MDYEWDDAKNTGNRQKHGVDFTSMSSFAWEFAVRELQYREGEERELVVGPIGDGLYAAIVVEKETKRGSFRFVLHPEKKNADGAENFTMTQKRRPPVIEDHSDEEEARIQRAIESDPDTWEARGRLVRRAVPARYGGMPEADAVALIIDRDVADALRQSNPEDWKKRANAILKEAVGL